MAKTLNFITCLLILNLWLICAAKPLEKAKKDDQMELVPQIFDLKAASRPMSKMALPISGTRRYDPWGGKRSTLKSSLGKDKNTICLHVESLVMYNYA